MTDEVVVEGDRVYMPCADRAMGVVMFVNIPNMTPELEVTRTAGQGEGGWAVRITLRSWFDNMGEWGLHGLGMGGEAHHAVYCPYDPANGHVEGLWYDDTHGVNQALIWGCY